VTKQESGSANLRCAGRCPFSLVSYRPAPEARGCRNSLYGFRQRERHGRAAPRMMGYEVLICSYAAYATNERTRWSAGNYNLNTHTTGGRSTEAFPTRQGPRTTCGGSIVTTPSHGSLVNVAGMRLSCMTAMLKERKKTDRRHRDDANPKCRLVSPVNKKQSRDGNHHRQARVKLKRLYPKS